MPAADELFRTTAGNGTLVREGREAREDDSAERPPARDRGHNPVAPPNGSGGSGANGPAGPGGPAASKGPAKTVPTPAASAEDAAAAVQASVAPAAPAPEPEPEAAKPAPTAQSRKVTAPRRPSGRERHDEKITVYVSPDELLGLEHARIMLRGEYGLAVDRGRIVREAVAALLADLDARGRDSILVKRLSAGG